MSGSDETAEEARRLAEERHLIASRNSSVMPDRMYARRLRSGSAAPVRIEARWRSLMRCCMCRRIPSVITSSRRSRSCARAQTPISARAPLRLRRASSVGTSQIAALLSPKPTYSLMIFGLPGWHRRSWSARRAGDLARRYCLWCRLVGARLGVETAGATRRLSRHCASCRCLVGPQPASEEAIQKLEAQWRRESNAAYIVLAILGEPWN